MLHNCRIIILIALLFLTQNQNKAMMLQLERKPLIMRWSVYTTMLWILFLYGNCSKQEFIYFTF